VSPLCEEQKGQCNIAALISYFLLIIYLLYTASLTTLCALLKSLTVLLEYLDFLQGAPPPTLVAMPMGSWSGKM